MVRPRHLLTLSLSLAATLAGCVAGDGGPRDDAVPGWFDLLVKDEGHVAYGERIDRNFVVAPWVAQLRVDLDFNNAVLFRDPDPLFAGTWTVVAPDGREIVRFQADATRSTFREDLADPLPGSYNVTLDTEPTPAGPSPTTILGSHWWMEISVAWRD